jgi:hypothetical protein
MLTPETHQLLKETCQLSKEAKHHVKWYLVLISAVAEICVAEPCVLRFTHKIF